MTITEGYQRAYGFASFATAAAYFVWLAVQLSHTPPAEINYVPAMLWAIGASFVIHSLGRGSAAHAAKGTDLRTDERDRDVTRRGDALSFYVFSYLAAVPLVLGLLEGDPFWITNSLFAAFAFAAVFGVVVKAILYSKAM